ncbi:MULTISPECIES: hypothetical protein, partial [unclassified Pseudomonas]|uniref:hypothetical protein n=1 Tax=unclassified Pseudomonas TaxID=196821 RepID=UPI001C48634A
MFVAECYSDAAAGHCLGNRVCRWSIKRWGANVGRMGTYAPFQPLTNRPVASGLAPRWAAK